MTKWWKYETIDLCKFVVTLICLVSMVSIPTNFFLNFSANFLMNFEEFFGKIFEESFWWNFWLTFWRIIWWLQFFGIFFFTYNLLTIASFRIGVSSILFLSCSQKVNINFRCISTTDNLHLYFGENDKTKTILAIFI